ncbi:MAG: SDR family NAD(P)-dependent oxidoreductase [Myxococcota bacterium]
MAKQMDERVVWITGGGSGIGRAMAIHYGSRGATVVVSGRRREKLDEVVERISEAGGTGAAHPLDVTDEKAVHDVVDAIIAEYGRLDVAVANAGFGVAGPIVGLSAADVRRQFDVNVVGLTTTVAAAYPHLRETKGRIVLVASVMSQLVVPGSGAYAASKYAVRAIGQTLSMELTGSGVSCTTVHPGFVESEIGQVDNAGRFDDSRKDPRPEKLMWSAERAAAVIVRAAERRKREYVFTAHGKFGAFIGRHLPAVNHLLMKGQRR